MASVSIQQIKELRERTVGRHGRLQEGPRPRPRATSTRLSRSSSRRAKPRAPSALARWPLRAPCASTWLRRWSVGGRHLRDQHRDRLQRRATTSSSPSPITPWLPSEGRRRRWQHRRSASLSVDGKTLDRARQRSHRRHRREDRRCVASRQARRWPMATMASVTRTCTWAARSACMIQHRGGETADAAKPRGGQAPSPTRPRCRSRR